MSLQKIMESTKVYDKKLRDETDQLVSKWKKTGLMDGLEKTKYEKYHVAQLLENQAKQLVVESSRTGTASNSEEWSGVALPLVRRIFSEIAAKDFVSVQPMSLPSGLVFWVDFKYGTGQPGFTTGSGKDSQADSVFGITGTIGSDASQGLYGAGRFGYSINEADTANLVSGSAPTATVFTTSSIAATDYNYDTSFSQSYAGQFGSAGSGMFKLTIASSSMTNPDPEGIRAYKVRGPGISTYFPQFTVANSNNSQISFVVSGSIGSYTGVGVAVTYHKQPTDITRGDFEATSDTDINIPEINVEMKSEAIVAKTRKLKAIWTPEFAQDLNAYHSIDAEAELTSMLSEYISMEIDLEILDMLIKNAATTDRWSAQIGRYYDHAASAFVDYATAQSQASAFNQGTWFQTLGTKIQKVSNKIHQKTMRGGANFLVCSPEVATILESIPGYSVDTDGNRSQFAMGVQKVGMINNRFQVYKNPYMLENTILLGYRGSQFLETGAVFCPYIPLILTPLVYDPNNFTPRRGVMCRYAKKLIRPEFYGKIHVTDLPNV